VLRLARYWIATVVVTTLLVGLGQFPSGASVREAGHVCARLSLDYEPHFIAPGGGQGFTLSVENCSGRVERLLFEAHASGPCGFAPPPPHLYGLGPHEGVTGTGDGFGPSCPGWYHVAGILRLGPHVVANDGAWFEVLSPPAAAGR
jgi:hypothetical protein